MHTIKLLKVGLPLATAASATAITASLVSIRREDAKLKDEHEDKVLEDFEKPFETFKEEKIIYSKDGTEEKTTVDQETLEEIAKERVGDGDKKELVKKLLEDPESLVKELLKKKGANLPKLSGTESELPQQAGLPEGMDREMPPVVQDSESEAPSLPVQETAGGGMNSERGEEAQLAGVGSEEALQREEEIRSSGVQQADSESIVEPTVPKGEPAGSPEKEVKVEENHASSESTGDTGGQEHSVEEESLEPSEDARNGDEDTASLDEKSSSPSAPSGTSEERSAARPEGHENGLQGEEGSEPITKEQLERMSEIEQKATLALTSLESLLGEI